MNLFDAMRKGGAAGRHATREMKKIEGEAEDTSRMSGEAAENHRRARRRRACVRCSGLWMRTCPRRANYWDRQRGGRSALTGRVLLCLPGRFLDLFFEAGGTRGLWFEFL